jgi:lipoate---protein ligase
VGKHQNALAEINPAFVRENKVHIIRRLSGGGAVYHDLGNLNFSFHQTVPDTSKISFKKFNEPIVEVLHQLGIAAEVGTRNDIFVDGYKVSGHAEHVFRNRVLSHGTLLFDAEKSALSQALKNPSFNNFEGKAIQSVRSKVANLVEFMKKPIAIEQFAELIKQHILSTFGNSKTYQLTDADSAAIEQLASEKYSTWEWNFGYSPKYRFEKSAQTLNGLLTVAMTVDKGLVVELSLSENLTENEMLVAIRQSVLKTPHDFSSIENRLLVLGIDQQFCRTLLSCFF